MATMVANDRPFEPIGAAIGGADNKSSCDGAAGTLNATAPGHVLGMLSRSDVVRLLAHPNRALEAAVDAELTSIGLTDWLVDAADGVVNLTGPENSPDRTVARLMASRVPGVIDVRIN
jgi:hypothetical protein